MGQLDRLKQAERKKKQAKQENRAGKMQAESETKKVGKETDVRVRVLERKELRKWYGDFLGYLEEGSTGKEQTVNNVINICSSVSVSGGEVVAHLGQNDYTVNSGRLVEAIINASRVNVEYRLLSKESEWKADYIIFKEDVA